MDGRGLIKGPGSFVVRFRPMRVLIATSEESIASVVSTLIRRVRPEATIIVADDVAGLGDDSDLAIVAVNSLDAGACSPEERIDRVLAGIRALRSPVLALVGWPEDGEARARAAGARAVLPMPFDVAALLAAVDRLLPQSSRQPDGSCS